MPADRMWSNCWLRASIQVKLQLSQVSAVSVPRTACAFSRAARRQLWIDAGFVLTVVPVLIVGVVAFKWMKVDFGSMAGMLCGSMANPMALNYANDTIPGDNPSVAYATVYPMCMFLRVIIAQVLLMFLLN